MHTIAFFNLSYEYKIGTSYFRSIVKILGEEREKNKSRVCFIERRENRHNERDKKKEERLARKRYLRERMLLIYMGESWYFIYSLSLFHIFNNIVIVLLVTILCQKTKGAQLKDPLSGLDLHLIIDGELIR